MNNPSSSVTPQLPCAVHVIGIGGAGMAALAEILLGLGCEVTGSDIKENPRTQRLSELGLQIAIGHAAGNIQGCDLVVHSTAILPENAELEAARQAGLPVWNRAALLRQLSDFKEVLAVAGTHGKTTTASMLSLVLLHARQHPSFIIGGDVNEVGSGASWNTGDSLVVEADESDGLFLALNQSQAIVTSIEPDHHTRYASYAALCRDFAAFLAQTSQTAIVHSQALAALAEHAEVPPEVRIISYGTDPSADYQLVGFAQHASSSSFAVLQQGQPWAELELPVPGLHNAENALAALLLALQLDVPLATAQASLSRFAGISRRFEFRGSQGGVAFVDDYAHLPTEIAAAIKTARDLEFERLVCVFQPHRYSRTKHLWPDFAHSFDGADRLVVSGIYSAGEMPLPGVTGELIIQAVQAAGQRAGTAAVPQVSWAPRLDDVVRILTAELVPGDLCLILGAGDIHLVIEQVQAQLAHSPPAQAASVAPGPDRAASQADPASFAAWHEELQALLPNCPVESNWPLGQHTSYRVGGPASLAVEVNTQEELARLAEFTASNFAKLPYLVLGNGTNLLVADSGFAGLVVRLGQGLAEIAMEPASLRAGAGASLPVAARQGAAAGLGGFEWAVGVPGTVGGGVRMNAGGHGSDISQSLRSATVCDLSTGLTQTVTAAELQLSYRHSTLQPSQLVCEAVFDLDETDPAQAKSLISEILRWRREHQPGGQNCGSVFINPTVISAGALLDQLGLKGHRVGSACISPKHANFIIADRHGSADDVRRLMCDVAAVVQRQTGIELVSETVLVGFEAPA